jgi:hypothetical protein
MYEELGLDSVSNGKFEASLLNLTLRKSIGHGQLLTFADFGATRLYRPVSVADPGGDRRPSRSIDLREMDLCCGRDRNR